MNRADLDRLADWLLDKATEGCCNNTAWRGRLCQQHQGFDDGTAAILDALEPVLLRRLDRAEQALAAVCGEQPVHVGMFAISRRALDEIRSPLDQPDDTT